MGLPTIRSSFLGHLLKPFFRAPNESTQVKVFEALRPQRIR
jgi:hypothetical protein